MLSTRVASRWQVGEVKDWEKSALLTRGDQDSFHPLVQLRERPYSVLLRDKKVDRKVERVRNSDQNVGQG